MEKSKRNTVLSAVRYQDDMTRHGLREKTGYTMTTVLSAIAELLGQGLIAEQSAGVGVGKRAWLRIRPEALYAVGVEFNAEQLNCVVVNFDYEVVHTVTERISAGDGERALLEKLRTTIRLALAYLEGAADRVVGIGFGLPGYVDRLGGVGLAYPYLPAWRDIPVRQIFSEEFGCRVAVENNIGAMATAYRWRNYREVAEDFVFVSMKYGVGMGIVLDNRLFTGGGHAGGIGHIRVGGGDRPCVCGQAGCLDSEASFPAIRRKLVDRMALGGFPDIRALTGGDPEKLTVDMLLDSARAGYGDAVDLLRESAGYLGQGLAMVLGTLNPRRVIIGNGLGYRPFSAAVLEALHEVTPPILLEGLAVESIVMPDNMGALGAAMLIMEAEFHSPEDCGPAPAVE